MKSNILLAISVAMLIAFTVIAITNARQSQQRLQHKEIELLDTSAELKKLQLNYEQLNINLDTEMDRKVKDQEKIEYLKQEKEKLEQERERLERELQAKRQRQETERQRMATARPTATARVNAQSAPQTQSQPARISYGGNKDTWLRASGIPEHDWWAVDYIVSRESSWNPNAVNASSGACGLGQQLPCGKWDSYGAWNDPVAALRAQHDYVKNRYGSYSQAVNFWKANHWY